MIEEKKISMNAIESVEKQMDSASPFKLTEDWCGKNVVFALGFVGGGGGAETARNMIEQRISKKFTPYILTTSSYLQSNPYLIQLIQQYNLTFKEIDDSRLEKTSNIYKSCGLALEEFKSKNNSITGMFVSGYHTYFSYAANKLGMKSVILDGALPDEYNENISGSGVPELPFDADVFRSEYVQYLCASGIPNNTPPQERILPGMKIKYCAYPFCEEKKSLLGDLRDADKEKIQKLLSDASKSNDVVRQVLELYNTNGKLLIPTMDHVYLNTDAAFMNKFPYLMEQTSAYIKDIFEVTQNSDKQERKIYLREGPMLDYLNSVYGQETVAKTAIVSNEGIKNDDRLAIRKLAIEIGRAPQCVSSQESWFMGKEILLTAAPGYGTDAEGNKVDYMDEGNAMDLLRNREPIAYLYDIGKGESCKQGVDKIMGK